MTGEDKFSSYFEKEVKEVEKILSKCLKNRKPQSLYSPAYYILESGGKRLRPLLVLLSAKAASGKNIKIYNAAAAVELLHNFTLVHDDIMDNADKRRGRLTLHKKYDLSTAILAGDSLLSVAYEYLIKDCSGDNTKEIIDIFNHAVIEVCEGQSLDKDFETQKNISLKNYILMIKKKTAAMAEMCCTLGAMLGGGSNSKVNALAAFGKNIGIAFQIQDDLLDISAVESEFGKVVGGDLLEGKKTFLFVRALEKALGKDKEDLISVIERKGATYEEIPKYRNLYEKLGIIEEAGKEIKRYTGKAVKGLSILKSREDREMFNQLADSLIGRNK